MLKAHLHPRYRAVLFNQLQSGDAAQPQLDRAYKLLDDGRRAAQQAQMMELADQFAGGQTALLDALRSTGHFLDWELATLQLGLSAGEARASYHYLVQHYARLATFETQLRRHMWLPLIVLLVTALGLPALGYAERSLDAVAAVGLALGALGAVALLAGLGYLALLRWRAGRLGQTALALLYRLPMVGTLLAQQQSLHYFAGLERSLAAGVPLAQSLRLAGDALPRSPCRMTLRAVEQEVAGGGRLSEALRRSGALAGVQIRSSIAPGTGGNIAALAPRVLAESTRLAVEEGLAQCARWLPQLLLIGVALVLLANGLALR